MWHSWWRNGRRAALTAALSAAAFVATCDPGDYGGGGRWVYDTVVVEEYWEGGYADCYSCGDEWSFDFFGDWWW